MSVSELGGVEMKERLSRLFGFSDPTETDAENKEEINKEEVKHIPVHLIVPNRYQPRTVFDEEKIEELSQTIKTHGIIQPIVVRTIGDKYEIIAGERRWRAYCKLGYPTIPALIKEYNEPQAASIALIENLQREGLTAIEEAKAYQQLMEMHHLTQESLAQRLGKSQSTIANKIRLLHLPEEVHQALFSRQITERHARALLSLKNKEDQLKILAEIIEKDYTVKQTENRIQQLLEKDSTPQQKKPRKLVIPKDVRIALNTIRQSVNMVMKTGMNVTTEEEDLGEYFQVTIRIPKKKS